MTIQTEDARKGENTYWSNGPGCRIQFPGITLGMSWYIFFQTTIKRVGRNKNKNKQNLLGFKNQAIERETKSHFVCRMVPENVARQDCSTQFKMLRTIMGALQVLLSDLLRRNIIISSTKIILLVSIYTSIKECLLSQSVTSRVRFEIKVNDSEQYYLQEQKTWTGNQTTSNFRKQDWH